MKLSSRVSVGINVNIVIIVLESWKTVNQNAFVVIWISTSNNENKSIHFWKLWINCIERLSNWFCYTWRVTSWNESRPGKEQSSMKLLFEAMPSHRNILVSNTDQAFFCSLPNYSPPRFVATNRHHPDTPMQVYYSRKKQGKQSETAQEVQRWAGGGNFK